MFTLTQMTYPCKDYHVYESQENSRCAEHVSAGRIPGLLTSLIIKLAFHAIILMDLFNYQRYGTHDLAISD